VKSTAVLSKGKVQWADVATDLDLAITADNERVSFDWIVKSENAPHEVTFEIQDGGIPVVYKGKDAQNKSVDVKILKNGKNIVESIEKGGQYPKTINPDFTIASWDRDCAVDWMGSDWEFYANWGNPSAGYIASDLCKTGMGLSYITTIPQQAYITSATVKFTAYFSYSGVTVRTKFTGQKLPTPYNFTTLASYQTQRGAVVGGADNSKITSAQVYWDNIGAWTSDSEYTSPNIATIIQEIVNDPGWNSSVKAVVLFWDDHDGRSSSSDMAGRNCYARDESSTKAPKLHVEYTVVVPTVTTQAASGVEATTATGNGNISSTGGASCSRRGFCYKVGTSGDPTVSDSIAYDDGSFGIGAYTKSITGLSTGTSYRVRAYAVNTAGTGYGTTVQIPMGHIRIRSGLAGQLPMGLLVTISIAAQIPIHQALQP
jgi:hypothetical protein